MQMHHVAVVCASRENADRFYRELLGLNVIKERTLDEAFMDALFQVPLDCELVLYGNEHVSVEVFVPPSFSHRPSPLAHCCLVVEDQEDFMKRCEEAGAKVRVVPRGEHRIVFVQDFDGNLFEIKAA